MIIPPFFAMAADYIHDLFATPKIRPADFRRGTARQPHHIIGSKPDLNSKNRGQFIGGIVPMKRRFKGVSRTQGRKQ